MIITLKSIRNVELNCEFWTNKKEINVFFFWKEEINVFQEKESISWYLGIKHSVFFF